MEPNGPLQVDLVPFVHFSELHTRAILNLLKEPWGSLDHTLRPSGFFLGGPQTSWLPVSPVLHTYAASLLVLCSPVSFVNTSTYVGMGRPRYWYPCVGWFPQHPGLDSATSCSQMRVEGVVCELWNIYKYIYIIGSTSASDVNIGHYITSMGPCFIFNILNETYICLLEHFNCHFTILT